ncbi:aminotransferase [Naasia sp. SYSU D00057]|uniref:aminotransferase n=1 Tax=Naasia sp. SYSU D00057 TaxID=2817380 RepID=UPI001B30B477|nr:aminotransferase [Naasia sp. SYSU D00057]
MTSGTTSFRAPSARPAVSPADAAEVGRSLFGLEGEVVELGSQEDRNFRIDTGDARFVLKFANPADSAAELEAQTQAGERLAAAGIPAPRAVPALDGRLLSETEVGGVSLRVRLLTYVEGFPLSDGGPFSPAAAAALGGIAGRVAAALTGFTHRGLERRTQWDLRSGREVVHALLPTVADGALRTRLRSAVAWSSSAVDAVRDGLRVSPIHGDVTDDNVVSSSGDAAAIDGVIDLGDVADGWLVAELAVACVAVLHHNPDQPLLVLDAAAAFAERMPLQEDEVRALWPLVVLRTAVLVASADASLALDEGNEYAAANRAHELLAFDVATALDPRLMEALLRERLFPSTLPAMGRLLPVSDPSVVDLSVTSPLLDAGRWLEDGIEHRLAASAAGTAVFRYGEYRLTRARLHARQTPTLALGVEVFPSVGTALTAPFAGEVTGTGDGLVLRGQGAELWLDGVAPDNGTRAVAAGDVLGATTGGPLRVQLSRLSGARPPFFVAPGDQAAWRRTCPDPSALLGLPAGLPEPDVDEVLSARDAAFARVQEHYYARPPRIERGWREHLVDVRAQVHVDLVNNVAAVGHAHPRLVEAVHRQWSLLNTNSRFHYAALARFSERLAALAPDGLDTVFLVNSGSEAVDLAIRLAQTATGRSTVLAVKEAYHGWTIGSDAVSSSIGDNPRALETRPDWVRLVDAPNAFRGRHRGPNSAPAYLADLDGMLADLDAAGTGVAAFLAEPVFGNAGGVLLPDGYLAGVYKRIRARGGLCIADEVQVGYGRLGTWFWGSEQQGVVPDIVTVAKAMGNGHPLGAVITTREIAERFAAEGSLFSSAGGSPVSCVVGETVLDILEDEHLQRNAEVVGGRLKAGIEALAPRFPVLGAVHGAGLYLGVELVRHAATLEPATAEAAAICEALLREGCIVQPTGDYKNILKIKPPMVLTDASVDFFLGALERVLAGTAR